MLHAHAFDPGFKFMTQEVRRAWTAHVLACYPNEACAYVTKKGLMPVVNLEADPDRFRVDEMDYLAAEADGLLAFLHSHRAVKNPDPASVPEQPSEADMHGQLAMAKPWGISACDGENVSELLWFGDQVPIAPLSGRVFVHGVWDCYSLIRDWYRLRGIVLPSQPRKDRWWEDEENNGHLYLTNFERAGFTRVYDEIRVGDLFLCSVRAPGILNHAGVYDGNSMIIQHLAGSLSGRTPAVRWQSKMGFIIRYKDPVPEAPDAA